MRYLNKSEFKYVSGGVVEISHFQTLMGVDKTKITVGFEESVHFNGIDFYNSCCYHNGAEVVNYCQVINGYKVYSLTYPIKGTSPYFLLEKI